GCRSSMIWKPAPSIPERLGMGNSQAPLGSAKRRRGPAAGGGGSGRVGRAPRRGRAARAPPRAKGAVGWAGGSRGVGGGGDRAEVGNRPSGAAPVTEETPPIPAAVAHFDEGGEAVFGPQDVGRLAALGHLRRYDRDRASGTGRPPPAYQSFVGQEDVTGVV